MRLCEQEVMRGRRAATGVWRNFFASLNFIIEGWCNVGGFGVEMSLTGRRHFHETPDLPDRRLRAFFEFHQTGEPAVGNRLNVRILFRW